MGCPRIKNLVGAFQSMEKPRSTRHVPSMPKVQKRYWAWKKWWGQECLNNNKATSFFMGVGNAETAGKQKVSKKIQKVISGPGGLLMVFLLPFQS